MSTHHRRINVTCDPELAAAMEVTRDLLPQQGYAGRLRALALAGSRALTAEAGSDESRRARSELLRRADIRAANDPDRTLPWLDDLLSAPPTDAGTQALDWVRGHR